MIEIRKAALSDLEQLQTIGKQTFFETFAEANTTENMKSYLESAYSVEQLTGELTNQFSEFYFALFDNKIAGYLKINYGLSQTELKDQNALEIERIYVLKEFQGKKVGQALYDTAYKIAMQRDVDYLWLGVWEENPRAISFYRKNGFIGFDRHIFKLGEDEQTDIMMRLKLK